jgi:hypothetical protein
LRQVSDEVEVELLAAKELCEKLVRASTSAIVANSRDLAALVKNIGVCLKKLIEL